MVKKKHLFSKLQWEFLNLEFLKIKYLFNSNFLKIKFIYYIENILNIELKNITTKISEINENNLKKASDFNCCLDNVRIYAIDVQPNHLSVVDAFAYHEF